MESLQATIIAVVMLVGVFVLVGVALFKGGVEAALKLWGVMGEPTGVGFGAITSFYFTGAVNQRQISQINEQKEAVQAEKKMR